MLIPLEITEMFKDFLNKNDLGPTKLFSAEKKTKRVYSEIEKQRLKNLTEIYRKFSLKQLKSQQLKEEIEKSLQISNDLALDIVKQIENSRHAEIQNETVVIDESAVNSRQNKKNIFSTLIEEKK